MPWFITLFKYVQIFKAIYSLGVKKNSKKLFQRDFHHDQNVVWWNLFNGYLRRAAKLSIAVVGILEIAMPDKADVFLTAYSVFIWLSAWHMLWPPTASYETWRCMTRWLTVGCNKVFAEWRLKLWGLYGLHLDWWCQKVSRWALIKTNDILACLSWVSTGAILRLPQCLCIDIADNG